MQSRSLSIALGALLSFTACLPSGSGSGSSGGADAGSDDAGSGSDDAGSAGGGACEKRIVLTGYWPPSNEMLRPYSTSAAQNPDGWQGADWEGLGYDVYAYFPEFPPDGDPTNDSYGSAGSVGSGDLTVDYQDSSADFWRIMDDLQPQIVITTSRGNGIGWEIEALEGGHGTAFNAPNPALDWSSDRHGAETRPTEASVDARSWAGINTCRDGYTIPSKLPLSAIERAAVQLDLVSVAIDEVGTSGNYLSGFMALHGLMYQAEHASYVSAAGHIHVGGAVTVSEARELIDATLRAVIEAHPAEAAACPEPVVYR